MKTYYASIIFTILIFFVVPSCFYMYWFTDQKISYSTSDWGNFGSYMSASIALCNLIIFIILTFELQRYNRTESEHAKALQKPIISFFKTNNSSDYAIENVGAGTALNIIVRAEYNPTEDGFQIFTRCYSLSSKSISIERWSNQHKVYVAEYNDIFGNKYYSYFEDNYLRFFSEEDGKRKNTFEYRRASLPFPKVRVVQD